MAAEIERDLISQRTKEAFRARKAAGVRLSRPKGPGKSKLDKYREKIITLLKIGSIKTFGVIMARAKSSSSSFCNKWRPDLCAWRWKYTKTLSWSSKFICNGRFPLASSSGSCDMVSDADLKTLVNDLGISFINFLARPWRFRNSFNFKYLYDICC